MEKSTHIPQLLQNASTGVILCVSEFDSDDHIAFQQGIQIELAIGDQSTLEDNLHTEETVKFVRRTLTNNVREKLPQSRADSHREVLDALLSGRAQFSPESTTYQKIRDEFDASLTLARLNLERSKIQKMFQYSGLFPQKQLREELDHYFNLSEGETTSSITTTSPEADMVNAVLTQTNQKWMAHGSTFVQLCSFVQNGGNINELFNVDKASSTYVSFLQKLSLPQDTQTIKRKLNEVTNSMYQNFDMLQRNAPRLLKTFQTIKRQSDEGHSYPYENTLSYYNIGTHFMLRHHRNSTFLIGKDYVDIENDLFGQITESDTVRYFDFLISQYLAQSNDTNDEDEEDAHKSHDSYEEGEYHEPFGSDYGTIFLYQIQNYVQAVHENDDVIIEQNYAHIPLLLRAARQYSMTQFRETLNSAGYSVDRIAKELTFYGRNVHEFAHQKCEHFIQGMHDYVTFYNFKMSQNQREREDIRFVG